MAVETPTTANGADGGSPHTQQPATTGPLDDHEAKAGDDVGDELMKAAEFKKKKNKKRKPKTGKTKRAITGFEDNYADAPLTPAEYTEEQILYDLRRSFADRIQTAIQRFVSKRRLDSERKDVFDKYLAFGGIDCGAKPFTGTTAADLEGLTADEIADAKAAHFVSSWALTESVVDFDGMVQAFLSSRMPKVFPLDSRDAIHRCVHVIRTFLSYLLHHDVCPEYKDQIFAARKTCDTGEAQLCLLRESARMLPGDFNKACSIIWGGQYRDAYVEPGSEWAKEAGIAPSMSMDLANRTVMAALSNESYFSEEVVAQYTAQNDAKKTKVVRAFQADLEVARIDFSNSQVRAQYGRAVLQGIKPLGRLTVRTWDHPGCLDEDLTEEEEAERAAKGRPVETYEFWVEDAVLENVFVGMKLQVVVRELSFGVFYFDTLTGSLCSFYNLVSNEDMIGWRAHKYLPPREEEVGEERGFDGEGKEGEGDKAGGGDDEPILEKFEKGEDINIQV